MVQSSGDCRLGSQTYDVAACGDNPPDLAVRRRVGLGLALAQPTSALQMEKLRLHRTDRSSNSTSFKKRGARSVRCHAAATGITL
jgi:hypothetical protein